MVSGVHYGEGDGDEERHSNPEHLLKGGVIVFTAKSSILRAARNANED
jgi:hypothetical protein